MEVIYNFIPQRGRKPKIKATGSLFIDHNEAGFISNDRVIAILKRPYVSYIGPFGIKINGFESMGYDKYGKEKFRFEEWYCSYKEIKE